MRILLLLALFTPVTYSINPGGQKPLVSTSAWIWIISAWIQLKRLLCTAVLAQAIFVNAAHAQTFGRNLIVNGDAEASVGTNGTAPAASIPGWTITGLANVVSYTPGYDLKDTDIVPVNQGKN